MTTTKADAAGASNRDSATLHSSGKQTITPAQRWMLICDNVYARAQKRGFVGGDPLQDLADAEQEIDVAHATDFEAVFSLTSTTEITEQLKSLFASCGFDQEHVDSLLDGHQEGLERLAAMNRELVDNASGLAAKQTEIFKDFASAAVRAFQGLAERRLRPATVPNAVDLSMQTLANALAGFQSLAQSASDISAENAKVATSQALLKDAVVTAYKGFSAKDLTAAPVTALKGISNSLGKSLEEEFAIRSINDMAKHPHTEWATAIVLLSDAKRLDEDRESCDNHVRSTTHAGDRKDSQSLADAPLNQVREIGENQIGLLRDAFGIVTVKDLATNRYFDIARAIVMLAESEN